jgi:phage FluMu protein Com
MGRGGPTHSEGFSGKRLTAEYAERELRCTHFLRGRRCDRLLAVAIGPFTCYRVHCRRCGRVNEFIGDIDKSLDTAPKLAQTTE